MNTIKASLGFDETTVGRPIITELVRDFGLVVNILQAEISTGKRGRSVVDMTGDEQQLKKALSYLEECGVSVSLFTTRIIHNDKKCVDCGACTSVCPNGALHIGEPDWTLMYEADRCVRCRQCVPACPMRAIDTSLFS